MEALGHYGMLCHADDAKSTFRVGFVHIEDEILTKGRNPPQLSSRFSMA